MDARKPKHPNGIQRPALVARGVGTQGHITAAVVVIALDVGPAEFHGLDHLLQTLGNVQDAAAFGSQ